MRAIIVRYNVCHDAPGNLLGFSVADDEEELHYLVDTQIEPDLCEYRSWNPVGSLGAERLISPRPTRKRLVGK